jgi:hypothetical protein
MRLGPDRAPRKDNWEATSRMTDDTRMIYSYLRASALIRKLTKAITVLSALKA